MHMPKKEKDLKEWGKILPIKEEEDCNHEEAVSYEHDGRLLTSCKICGATMDFRDWNNQKAKRPTDRKPKDRP